MKELIETYVNYRQGLKRLSFVELREIKKVLQEYKESKGE